MVYCTKCGTKNEDNLKFCTNCGAALYPEEKTEKPYRRERRVEDECFGLPYGGAIAGAVFGIFIIILGITIYLGQDFGKWFWPFLLVIFGILLFAGALRRMSRRRT